MTEEIKNVDVKEEKCNCICQSKGFRKFLIVAGGTFVGVFCALSLFAALHKPPMMMHPAHFGGHMMSLIFRSAQSAAASSLIEKPLRSASSGHSNASSNS